MPCELLKQLEKGRLILSKRWCRWHKLISLYEQPTQTINNKTPPPAAFIPDCKWNDCVILSVEKNMKVSWSAVLFFWAEKEELLRELFLCAYITSGTRLFDVLWTVWYFKRGDVEKKKQKMGLFIACTDGFYPLKAELRACENLGLYVCVCFTVD